MPKKIYVVKLSAEERAELEGMVRKGKAAGWKIQRAQALLKCDQGPGGPGWIDQRIADQDTVAEEARAWDTQRNALQVGVDWQFTTDGARIKLKH